MSYGEAVMTGNRGQVAIEFILIVGIVLLPLSRSSGGSRLKPIFK